VPRAKEKAAKRARREADIYCFGSEIKMKRLKI
jgi:hypothetical protein